MPKSGQPKQPGVGSRGGGRPRGADATARPASVEQALARAGEHARSALRETLATVHALLDAASLLTSGEPSEAHRLLGPIARLLQGLGAELDGDSEEAAALLRALAEALDSEISRWEDRARDDDEARSVLRAFLGLRELLWEVGVRRDGDAGKGGKPGARKPRKAGRPTKPKGPRVRRVPVEG